MYSHVKDVAYSKDRSGRYQLLLVDAKPLSSQHTCSNRASRNKGLLIVEGIPVSTGEAGFRVKGAPPSRKVNQEGSTASTSSGGGTAATNEAGAGVAMSSAFGTRCIGRARLR